MSQRNPRLNRTPQLRYNTRVNSSVNERKEPLAGTSSRNSVSADMDVRGTGSSPIVRPVNMPKPTSPESAARQTPTSGASNADGDQIEISAEAIGKSNAENNLRQQRLDAIKAAIDAGTYETPDKLEAALGMLFGELGLDED